MFMRIFRMFSLILYILYVVRHSILRDGSGPGRLNRHRQEILTFWKILFSLSFFFSYFSYFTWVWGILSLPRTSFRRL